MTRKLLLSIILSFYIAGISPAGDYTWTNPGTGSWSVSTNWDADPVAGADNHVFINTGIMNFSVAGNVGPFSSYNIANQAGATAVANHSAGELQSTKINVGTGNNSFGTVNLSSGVIKTENMTVGSGSGTGTVNLTGGGLWAYNDMTYDGTVYVGSRGTFEHSGGSFMTINANVTGAYNLSGSGYIYIYNTMAINGTYSQTGGTARALEFYIGNYGNGVANLSAGTLQPSCCFMVGYDGNGTFNQTGGKVEGSNAIVGNNGIGVANFFDGTFEVDWWTIGFRNGTGTVNVYGGNLNFKDTFDGNDKSSFNVLGSGATIQAKQITGSQAMNFTLDSYGVSVLNTGSIALKDSSVNLGIPGFVSMKVDSTDVLHTGTGLASLLTQNNTPFAEVRFPDGADVLRLEMTNVTEDWNLQGVYHIPDGEGLLGAVKVHGERAPVQAVFTGLGLDDKLAALLMNYLNSTLLETGVHFSPMNEFSLMLNGDYLNDQGYAWFGWDLNDFNDKYGTDVHLRQFNLLDPLERDVDVPEPATWALLLLGGGTLFVMQRRRR